MSKDLVARIVENVEVFTSSDHRPYAYIPCPADVRAQQAVPLRSAAFRNWFFGEHLSHVTYVPGPHAFRTVLNLLEARAVRDPDRIGWIVHRRVGSLPAAGGPTLLLDLANPSGEVIRISPAGWKLEPRCSVPFEPSASALPIPMPVESPGDPLAPLETLRSCLNLASHADWLRCLDWLLAALRPDGPHPVLILQGPPGSGKSFAARVLRAFLDPATAPLAATPTSVRDVVGLARRHWIVALDHISRLSPNVAGAIARLGSGLGATFHEELRGSGAQPVEVSYRRPVLLTVTGKFTCPESIASRALTVDFPPIPPSAQRTEEELRGILNAAFPAILGALLALAAQSLAPAASLLTRAQPAPDIQRGEDPGRVPFVPLHRPPCEEAPHVVQQEVPAERQLHADNIETVGRTGECREILPGEILETGGRHMPLVGRIDIGVVRAEMRSGDEHLGPVPGHPVDFRHGPHRVVQMLDHVRHVDLGEPVALQRPGYVSRFQTWSAAGPADTSIPIASAAIFRFPQGQSLREQ